MAASAISVSANAAGHWCLSSVMPEGCSLTWNAPPQALGVLLRELFAAQPEDVLTWVHGAVWQMHAREGSALDAASEMALSTPSPPRPPDSAELAGRQNKEVSPVQTGDPSEAPLVSLVPTLTSDPDMNGIHGATLVTPMPAGCSERASRTSSCSARMSQVVPDVRCNSIFRCLSSDATAVSRVQPPSFLRHFKSQHVVLEAFPSISQGRTLRVCLHACVISELIFLGCVLYEVAVVPYVLIFTPNSRFWHMAVKAFFLFMYCMHGLLHLSQRLFGGECAVVGRLLAFDIAAALADAAYLGLALTDNEIPALACLKVLRIFHLQRLLDEYWSCIRRFEVYMQVKLALRLFLMHAVLVFSAHAHAIAWGLFDSSLVVPTTTQEGYEHYFECFWLAYNSITFGNDMPAHTYTQKVLGIFFAAVRTMMLVFGIVWLWGTLLLRNLQDAKDEKHHEAILAYLQLRDVPFSLRVRAKVGLEERAKEEGQCPLQGTAWNKLPGALQQELCYILWMPRLRTLGIIRDIIEMCPGLGRELCMLVREEVMPKDAAVFVHGEKSNAAYFVIGGMLEVKYGEETEALDDRVFRAGMWVGEQATVNPELLRMQTIVCKTRAELMVVPTCEFHALLGRFGVTDGFKNLIHTKLWRGLCGRCGAFGSHFGDECPLLRRKVARTNTLFKKDSMVSPEDEDAGCCSNGLSMFLSDNNLDRLQGPLHKCGIKHLRDLNPSSIQSVLSDTDVDVSPAEKNALSEPAVERFKHSLEKRIERDMNELLAQGSYLIFISHYKAEAGTEASLMQSGLELLIQSDPGNPGRDMPRPVFIDTEDLRDLRELGEHVRKSHNLIILLTKGLLTRPWCLVEIATAVQAGVRVVPVEIQRKDMAFGYPDETFYQRLLLGEELDSDATKILIDEGIDMQCLVKGLRQVFKRIALPYSPHKTAMIREAELKDILKECRLRQCREHLPHDSRHNSFLAK